MRFAISAVAALSGLLLLALSFYGQPAVYLHQARQQWRELVQAPSDEVAKPLEIDADAARVAQLQQQVAELEHKLANGTQMGASPPAGSPTASPGPQNGSGAPEQQALVSQPVSPPATDPRLFPMPQHDVSALPTPPVPPVVSPPLASPPTGSQLPLAQGAPAQSVATPLPVTPPPAAQQALNAPALLAPPPDVSPVVPPIPSAPASGPAPPVAPVAPAPLVADVAAAKANPAASATSPAAVSLPPLPAPDLILPALPSLEQVGPSPSMIVAPERREPVSTPPPATDLAAVKPQLDQAKTGPATNNAPPPGPTKTAAARNSAPRGNPSRDNQTRAETAANEPVIALPQKSAALRPPPPPPLPQQAPSQQDSNDTESVLARLRQLAPAATQAEQPSSLSTVETTPRPVQPPPLSPSMPKLLAARTALASGRVDDARRMLQEAQLQLVFRPVSASGEAAPGAEKGSSDVAHALEALSANNVELSRRYIDVAVADVSGATTQPVQEPQYPVSGYAPAYPSP